MPPGFRFYDVPFSGWTQVRLSVPTKATVSLTDPRVHFLAGEFSPVRFSDFCAISTLPSSLKWANRVPAQFLGAARATAAQTVSSRTAAFESDIVGGLFAEILSPVGNFGTCSRST